jgi:NDP-sugar pyrophosphorylase family protein
MRTVLFCGGLGLRLREHTERVPKPWFRSATARCCGT